MIIDWGYTPILTGNLARQIGMERMAAVPVPHTGYQALYPSDLATLEDIQYTGACDYSAEWRIDRLIDFGLVEATGLYWCQQLKRHSYQFGLTRKGRIIRRYLINLERDQRLRAGQRVECYDVPHAEVTTSLTDSAALWLMPLPVDLRSGVLVRVEGKQHRVAVVLLDGDAHETRWPLTKVRGL